MSDFGRYRIESWELDSGDWYWAVYHAGQRINGGISLTRWSAERNAKVAIAFDQNARLPQTWDRASLLVDLSKVENTIL